MKLTPDQQTRAADPRGIAFAKRLAVGVCRRAAAGGSRVEYDEVEGAALLALVRVAGRFDPARSSLSWAAYRSARLPHALVDELRAMWGRMKERNGRFTLTLRTRGFDSGDAGGEPQPGERLVPDRAAPVGADVDRADEVRGLLRRAPRAQRELLEAFYLRGESADDIARAVGVRKATTYTGIHVALKRVRKAVRA